MRNPKWLVDKMSGMVSISYLPPSQEKMLNEFKMRFQTPYGVIEMQRQSGPIMCEMATLDDVYLSHMNLPQEEDPHGVSRDVAMAFEIRSVMTSDPDKIEEAQAEFVKRYEQLLKQTIVTGVHDK
jgi:hypothetical protein